MRFVLFSDLQLHPWKDFALYKNGVNNRLLDHFEVLEQVLAYTVKHKIKYLVFGGDMFEARGKIDVVAAKMLAQWKWKVSRAGITQVDIVGNHDLVDKSTLHNSIDIYRDIPNQHIITEPGWWKNIYCVPFMHRLEDIQKAITNIPDGPAQSAAIVHYGMYNVPMETMSVIRDLGYDTEGQIRLSELDEMAKRFQYIFFGHFHITSAITDKIHFIGTPLQHKWGERFVDTRFLDVDLSQGTFVPIETKAPRFIEFDKHDKVGVDPRVYGNFCRVKVETPEERGQYIALLKLLGARGADAIIVSKKQQTETRIGIDLSMSFEQMGAKMVDSDRETKLDPARLKLTLLEALKEATNRKNATG